MLLRKFKNKHCQHSICFYMDPNGGS